MPDTNHIECNAALTKEKMLEKCSAGKVYVTAFPDFKEFKKWSNKIAWETENLDL